MIGHGRKVMKDGDIDHECGVICTTIYQSVADYHGVIETNNVLMHEEKMRFARLDIVLIQTKLSGTRSSRHDTSQDDFASQAASRHRTRSSGMAIPSIDQGEP